MFAPRVSTRPRGILDEPRRFPTPKPSVGRARRVDLARYSRKHPLEPPEPGFFASLQAGLCWVSDRLRQRLGHPDPRGVRPPARLGSPGEMD